MTYCVAISVADGLVFASDSRTNAGVDQISAYSKMHRFGGDGQRAFTLLSAGNLATTQGVMASVERDIPSRADVNLVYRGDTLPGPPLAALEAARVARIA